ncbi:hypothetical protein [Streptomyces sp. NBC_00503]|uniref:hypothetical protein n=1 Tax=Streptomyces sp. NBC_00503 TaxID=2903659 RepID=UPI002E7FFA7E|nr:hypothetical protein [Streptomyces sp. NBC_00503]WUD86301.1 hypothetical protein OG490_36685 [Streptomyces sp. NBC_00503]
MATPDVPADTLEVVHMTSTGTDPKAPSGIRRIVAASLIGTTIEWYDNSSDQSYHLQLLCVQPLALRGKGSERPELSQVSSQ